VLVAALASACLGGQTGEPTSLRCGSAELSPRATWSKTTVEAAARTFAGTYAAGLQWQAESRGATAHSAVEFEDGAQLIVSYGGDDAHHDCFDQLSVPVTVTLTTTPSGILDTGVGELTIVRSSQALVGTLHYESELVRLDATLDEAAAATAPRGGFDALDSSLPGLSATFTEVP
jgi:hypothetical protein